MRKINILYIVMILLVSIISVQARIQDDICVATKLDGNFNVMPEVNSTISLSETGTYISVSGIGNASNGASTTALKRNGSDTKKVVIDGAKGLVGCNSSYSEFTIVFWKNFTTSLSEGVSVMSRQSVVPLPLNIKSCRGPGDCADQVDPGSLEMLLQQSSQVRFTTLTPTANIWNHYVMVKNGTNNTLFINGGIVGGGIQETQILHSTIPQWTYTPSEEFRILGNAETSGQRAFSDFAIIRRALTDEEVRLVYDSGLTALFESDEPPPPPAPDQPILTSPFNTTVHNFNQTLTYSSVGADSFDVFFEFNDSTPDILVCDNTTSLTCLGNATSGEGNYFWNVVGKNEQGDSVVSETRFWEFDTTNVLITYAVPSLFNTTTIGAIDLQLNVTIFNINLDTVIVNVTNPLGVEIYRNETSGISAQTFNIITIMDVVESGDYLVRAFGNDSAGLETQLDVTFFADTDTPQTSEFTNNYTDGSLSVLFNATFTDNVNLSEYVFAWNDTGSFVLDGAVIISGTSHNAVIEKTITAANNTFICGNFSIVDQFINENSSPLSCFTFILPNFPPPIFTGLSNDYVNESENVTFIVNVSASLNLSSYIFSWNDTGIFVNDSPVVLSGVPSAELSVFKDITTANNTFICGLWFVDDTVGTISESGLSCLTFIAPPVVAVTEQQFGFLSIIPIVLVLSLFIGIFRLVFRGTKPE